ncbi:MAG: single-stranded DNA-binding protein [Propionibacteriaceae bacterium]|jgi:single-strand DNA-binding protein|nr:single-stranded DNA-binding protein [Propionibacteriaceae bacterium]
MDTTMTLTGYAGHSAELKQTRTGVATASFRVATTPRLRTESGWTDGVTTWVSVVCYRALAEHVARCVLKGDPVIVHGRVRTQAWTDAQGTPHERMIVEANTVGHDLNRGVAAFMRPPRHAEPAADLPRPGDLAEPPADEEPPDDLGYDPESVLTAEQTVLAA